MDLKKLLLSAAFYTKNNLKVIKGDGNFLQVCMFKNIPVILLFSKTFRLVLLIILLILNGE
jgi:hypothetical protein